MAWVRIDTGFARHPKLLSVTPADRWVHLAAMCWVAENHTDGLIPRPVIDVIAPGARKAAPRLVDAGLWEPADGGWMIHDWTEYNISADESKRQLQAKRDRQRQWVQKKREERAARTTTKVDRSVDASTPTSNGASKDAPTRARKTRPDPTPSSKEEGRVGGVAATPEPEPGAQAPPPPEPGAGASAHEWRQWNKQRRDDTDDRRTLAELARADENLPAFLKVALERTGVVPTNGHAPALTVIPGGDGGQP